MITESEPEFTVECLPDGQINVRRTIYVLRDGVVIGQPENFRFTREPGDDVADLPEDVRVVIAAHWSEARVARFAALKAAREKASPFDVDLGIAQRLTKVEGAA